MAGNIDPNTELQFNNKESRFLLAIVNDLQSKANVDWEAVAKEVGFANARTANTRWGQIKKKFDFSTTTTAGVKKRRAPTTPSKTRPTAQNVDHELLVAPAPGGTAREDNGILDQDIGAGQNDTETTETVLNEAKEVFSDIKPLEKIHWHELRYSAG
ncbi:hypothetical protein BJ170DRAFT_685873 [Xylariales sp. AK1849]|nr:hypothetical protein BJ170DRAFT_685873 [Xylariales sp. AK1849]